MIGYDETKRKTNIGNHGFGTQRQPQARHLGQTACDEGGAGVQAQVEAFVSIYVRVAFTLVCHQKPARTCVCKS